MKHDMTEGVLNDLNKAAENAEDALMGEEGGRMQAAKAKLHSALSAARDAYDRLSEKAVAAGKATDRTIRDHPYGSIGIAFAAGIILGLILHRRRGE